MNDWALLACLYLLLLTNSSHKGLSYLFLWYIIQCTLNMAFTLPDQLFYVFNIVICYLLMTRIEKASSNINDNNSLHVLDAILVSCICLNLVGILDFSLNTGIMGEYYYIAEEGAKWQTIMELSVLFGLGMNGILNSVISGLHNISSAILNRKGTTASLENY